MRISDWSSDVFSSDLLGIGIRFNFATSRHIDQTSLTLQPSLNGMSKAENDEGKKDRSRRSSLRHRARARGRGRLVVPAARARSLSRPTALQRLREATRNRSQCPLKTAQEKDRGRTIPHGAQPRRTTQAAYSTQNSR